MNDIGKLAECFACEARQVVEAAALKRLNDASSRLWRTTSLRDGLEEMLAATIELLGADMGNIQLHDEASGNLTIAAQRGFDKEFLDFFREVSVEDDSACGQALRARERIVIEDVEQDPLFAPCRQIARNAGFRAVQSTPLVDRNGKPLGMISTHFRLPHRPNESDLQRLDLYAGQASDFIERCRLESDLRSVSTALRDKDEKLTFALEASGIGVWDVDLSNGLAFRSKEHARIFGYDEPDAEWRLERFLAHVLEADREEAKRTLSDAIKDRSSFISEFRIRRVDGAVRWLWVSGKYREGSDEEPPHFAGVVRDITDLKRAEDSVRETDARLTFIAERAEVGYWEWDLNAGIVECSPQCRKLFDYAEDEAVTYERFLSSIHPDDRERTAKAVAECLDGTANYDIQFRVITPADGAKWIHSKGNATFSNGHPSTMAGIAIDVSKQKRAEEELRERSQHMQLATEATGVGIWEWNIGTDEIRWDPQMFSIYGIEETAGGMVDYSTWAGAVLPEELPEQEKLLRQHALEGGISYRRFRIRRRVDAEVRDIEACEIGRSDETGRRRWVVGTNLDVTARREAEAALRDANRRKDEFLATLAHELRNPLAAICAAAQVARRLAAFSPPNGEKLLSAIERQSQQLTRIVDDLMDVSRITLGKIDLQRECVDLGEVVRDANDAANLKLDNSRHELTVSLPKQSILVDGDRVRLGQVFTNILVNAKKYTPAGGAIDVSLTESDGRAVVRVRDRGVGIPSEMLSQVFDLFAQVDHNLGRAQGGIGVGLALSRKLVELHGGSIAAFSDGPGCGSEFVVELPLSRACEQEGACLKQTNEPTDAIRVLLADDDALLAELTGDLIASFGANVKVVHSGPEALAAILLFDPQLVLVDIGMPGMNGYETARRIRLLDGNRSRRVVALSGWGQPEDIRRGAEAGFDAHFVKPIKEPELGALLDSLHLKARDSS